MLKSRIFKGLKGFPRKERSPSFTLEPIERKRVVNQDVLPPRLAGLDYFQVMEHWRLFDRNGNGMLDKHEFFQLMNFAMEAQHVSKGWCDQVFAMVDKDDSGEIDLEEFLAWCFSLHGTYCGDVRRRLGDMDPLCVVDYFRRVDTNGNGELDKQEMFQFIRKFAPDARMSREETDELFEYIDRDGSGEIGPKEFLAWVYPDRVVPGFGSDDSPKANPDRSPEAVNAAAKGFQQESRTRAVRRRRSMPSSVMRPMSPSLKEPKSPRPGQRMPTIGASPQEQMARIPSHASVLPKLRRGVSTGSMGNRRPSTADEKPVTRRQPTLENLREGLPQGVLVAEFTVGSDFFSIMNEIMKALRKNFGDLISVKTITQAGCKGCSRCVLHVGRGVVLWDRPTMMMHRDDPFESFESSRDFIMECISSRIPTLLRAASVATLAKR